MVYMKVFLRFLQYMQRINFTTFIRNLYLRKPTALTVYVSNNQPLSIDNGKCRFYVLPLTIFCPTLIDILLISEPIFKNHYYFEM